MRTTPDSTTRTATTPRVACSRRLMLECTLWRLCVPRPVIPRGGRCRRRKRTAASPNACPVREQPLRRDWRACPAVWPARKYACAPEYKN
ncbi:hypothetical protein HSEST_0309 [Halapricum desulfuricans]|uniref:Uncharacterized protein n=1 Tax=Halapricum desulfuricans TaxID=2841257 RepID=A0A897NSW8_9EURY|nr:hypothetical protein HSEST_0309 [Halapricum desulfuricans]